MWCSPAQWRRSSTWTRCSTRTHARWAPTGPHETQPSGIPSQGFFSQWFPSLRPTLRVSAAPLGPRPQAVGTNPKRLCSPSWSSLGDRQASGWGIRSRKTLQHKAKVTAGPLWFLSRCPGPSCCSAFPHPCPKPLFLVGNKCAPSPKERNRVWGGVRWERTRTVVRPLLGRGVVCRE